MHATIETILREQFKWPRTKRLLFALVAMSDKGAKTLKSLMNVVDEGSEISKVIAISSSPAHYNTVWALRNSNQPRIQATSLLPTAYGFEIVRKYVGKS